MSLILIIILLVLLFGGGGGYYAHRTYGLPGLGGVLGLVLIIIVLLWLFGDVRYAASVFAVVPFALTGGILGLLLRGLCW